MSKIIIMLGKKAGGIGYLETNRDNPNYCIVEIGQNTEKSPGGLRRLTVTQTLVKDHQLALEEKSIRSIIIKD